MDFVDWCSHVLNVLIQALAEPENARKSDLDEIRLYHSLFGNDAPFKKSPRRDAMRDVLKELSKKEVGLVEGRDMHWRATREGRERTLDMTPLWRDICAAQLAADEQELLLFVNSHSQQKEGGGDYVWLLQVSTDDLMGLWGSQDREATYYRFHKIASDLNELGLLEMRAFPGYHLNLKATYRGIVWETRRELFNKCDVFISHITEEGEIAGKLKSFLKDSFGENLKIFVSSDYRSIPSGKVWYTEIIDSLLAARVVLVLLSEASVERRWINFEAGIGIGSGSLVIPLVTEGLPKGKVGPPLSQLQLRSLIDAGDVEGMLADMSELLEREPAAVDTTAFLKHSSSSGGSKLDATVNHVPAGAYDRYMEHSLIIGVVNNSEKTITEFRVEVEVPEPFNNPTAMYSGVEVGDRRTRRSRYFRMESKAHAISELRPGDPVRQFLKLSLVVPSGALDGPDADKMLTVQVFAGDVRTQKIEMSMRDLLSQPPSFG